jgi:hypothetical protein
MWNVSTIIGANRRARDDEGTWSGKTSEEVLLFVLSASEPHPSSLVI